MITNPEQCDQWVCKELCERFTSQYFPKANVYNFDHFETKEYVSTEDFLREDHQNSKFTRLLFHTCCGTIDVNMVICAGACMPPSLMEYYIDNDILVVYVNNSSAGFSDYEKHGMLDMNVDRFNHSDAYGSYSVDKTYAFYVGLRDKLSTSSILISMLAELRVAITDNVKLHTPWCTLGLKLYSIAIMKDYTDDRYLDAVKFANLAEGIHRLKLYHPNEYKEFMKLFTEGTTEDDEFTIRQLIHLSKYLFGSTKGE